MNYEPNTVDWQVGDFVIHDGDAKRSRTLMLVIEKQDEDYIVIYPFHKYWGEVTKLRCNKGLYVQCHLCTKECLHDPARFDIDVPTLARARHG